MGISMNMPRLSRDQRQRALGMLQGELSYREVARRFGCSHQTISALVDRYTLHNSNPNPNPNPNPNSNPKTLKP